MASVYPANRQRPSLRPKAAVALKERDSSAQGNALVVLHISRPGLLNSVV